MKKEDVYEGMLIKRRDGSNFSNGKLICQVCKNPVKGGIWAGIGHVWISSRGGLTYMSISNLIEVKLTKKDLLG